jgi:2-oxoglutarate ferredoxin oxidoreductase subunit beta
MPSKSTPQGVLETPLNPIALAITAGATFVARGFSGNEKHLTNLITKAIQHKGFSVIDILQPCKTFNKLNTFHYFYEKVYDLQKEGYKPDNKQKAFQKAQEWEKKIPIGVFYKERKKTYGEELPQIKEKPLIKQSLAGINLAENMKELT